MKFISNLLFFTSFLTTVNILAQNEQQQLPQFFQEHDDHIVCGMSKDVMLEHSTPPLKLLSDYPASTEFDCGKFKVFYADLLPGAPAGGFADPTFGAVRRNTLCAVLNYVESVFDLSNVPDHSIRIEVEPSWIMSLNQAPTAVNYFAYAGPNYSSVAPNTIMGGAVYDFITTGVDPALSSEFHGYLKVNFSTVGSYIAPINWLNDHTQNLSSCQLDLFYILLHEVGHILGFGSTANDGGTLAPSSLFGNNNFSRLDFLLHRSSGFGAENLQKFILGTPNAAYLNPAFSSTTAMIDNDFWINGSSAPNNHPVYSGTYGGTGLSNNSILSHLDEQIKAYTYRARNAPGYAENYVMGPFGIRGAERRIFTDAEIKIFMDLGYLLNPSYVNANLNNLPPYSIKIGEDSDYPNSIDTSPWGMYVESVDANETIINDAGATVTFNLWEDPEIEDPEGQPLTVADGTLTNIRGCGNGGNNHAQLALSADKKTIIFTPRANFIGRAQFAFKLFDGVKIGSWHLYTIDVQSGNNVNYPTGTNIVINGNLEEGTEIRRAGADINNVYTTVELDRIREGFLRGHHYSDANPFNAWGNPFWPVGAGDIIRNSDVDCSASYPGSFGTSTNSCPTTLSNSSPRTPEPSGNLGDRYRGIYWFANYLGLGTPMQTCHKYVLKFDYSFASYETVLSSSYPLTVGFTNVPTLPAYPTLVNTFTEDLNVTSVGTWTTVVVPFNYCDVSSTNFLAMQGPENIEGLLLDNIEIVEVANFPQLAVSISGNNGLCSGGSTTLTATVSNSLCNTTYLWSNGMTTPSITVSPSSNQTYTVTVTSGGCSVSASQLVTVSNQPVIQNMADLTFCEKTEVPSIPIVSNPTGAAIDWTNSNTAIGVPAAGTGDFPSFTATNDDLNGNAISSMVTVTPTLNGCVGSTVSFTITINNEPILDPIVDQEFCSNSVANVNDFSTIPVGSTYTWTSSNAAIGLATSGSGNIPLFNAINSTTGPISSTINVTPNINGCVGAEVSFLVTVKPAPKVNQLTNQILCNGESTNAINFSGTAGSTFDWLNSNTTTGLGASGTGNIPSFIATNTGDVPNISIVSVTANLNGCVGTSTSFSITVNPTPVINAINDQSLCAGVATLPVVFSSNTAGATYSWSNTNPAIGLAAGGSGNIPSFIATNGISSPISGVISVKAILNGCLSSTVTFTITVYPLPQISITPPSATITQGNSVNLTASGAMSYNWSPTTGLSCVNCANPVASPNTTTTYTATGTNFYGCTSSSSVQIIVEQIIPCNSCPVSNTLIGNLSSNPAPKQSYCIDGDLNIVGVNVVFRTSEFKIGSNVTITVQPNAILTIQGCHLYSCGEMWKGIVVRPGGRLIIENGSSTAPNIASITSLIEDAVVAIRIENHTVASNILRVSNVLFNRNQTGIRISNYTANLTTNPFDITNCTFTSRRILVPPFSPFAPNASALWPQNTGAEVRTTVTTPNNLGNGYIINGTYSQTVTTAFLKAPFTGTKPIAGLELINVGNTQNVGTPNVPTYNEFSLGSATNMNIFDNQKYGVKLLNSNFKTVNSVFQNTVGKGFGIHAQAETNFNNRLQVVPVLTIVGGNKFADCETAIRTEDYFEVSIQYADVRSTQANWDQSSTKWGFQLNTNRFYNYSIRYNNIYNVTSAVMINTDNDLFSLNGPSIFGQFAGRINVDYNTIRPHLATATNVTSQYVANAITLSNSGFVTHLINGAPSVISTNTNWIRACRGIFATNWKRYNVQCQNNNITVLNNINAAPGFTPVYYGISVNNSLEASANGCFIRQNNVSGFYTPTTNPNTANDPNLTGIVNSLCPRFLVSCNTTSNTTRGIGFNGANQSTLFRNNSMQGHRYGFFIDQAGFISQQGSATMPTDNRWTGTWLPGNFKTATLGSSASANSQMWVRIGTNTATYNPNLSSISQPVNNSSLRYQLNFNLLGAPLAAPTIDFSCFQFIPFPFVIKSLEKIVGDSIIYVEGNELSEKMRFISKNLAFEAVKLDSMLLDSSNVLFDFYSNNSASSFEKIYSIQKLLSHGELAFASLSNSIFNPENNIEDNYKRYNEIYVKFKEGNAVAADSSNLKEIANKCPYTDGTVVYQARALFNLIFDIKDEYLDLCNEGNAAKSMMIEVVNDNDGELLLYPNPTKEDVYIKTDDSNLEKVAIEICDASGKIVFENRSIDMISGVGHFKLNITNGIYFVKIFLGNSDEFVTEKLFINK
jgi:hypothetical protein